MSDLNTLKQRLSEAEEAEHQLMIGKTVASVGYNGQQVAFTRASLDKLRTYIKGLKTKIAHMENKRGSRQVLLVEF